MKKSLTKLGVAITMVVLSISSMAQNMALGVALKASTMGVGADAVLQFHEKMDVRLGYDMLNLGPYNFSFKDNGINYDAEATVKTGSLTALYDYYLAKNVFVAVGVGMNNFNVNVDGAAAEDMQWGDVTIDKEKVGEFEFGIAPGLKISPYLGLGFGRAISQDKLVGFAFELGTYYMGGPDITINSTGLLGPTSNPDHGQEVLFESQLNQFGFYPVLKFSLSFRIASL